MYSYERIDFVPPTALGVVASFSALLLVAVLLPNKVSRPSDGALWLLASFVVSPTIAVAAVNPFFDFQVSWLASFSVVVGFLVTAMLTKGIKPPKESPEMGLLTNGTFVGVTLVLSILAILTVIVGFGLSTFDLSLGDEYERRATASQLPVPYPGANYFYSWLKAVLVPLLFVLSVQWRRPVLLAMGVLSVLVIFSFSGEKAAFVYPLIALLLVVGLRRAQAGSQKPWFGALLTLGIIGASTLLGRVLPTSGLDVLIARRFGLVPGLLTHSYVEFTQTEGFSLFRQSWLKFFSSGEAARPLGLRVGEVLQPESYLDANANVWADGYGSAGLLGVVLISVALAFLLRIMDRVALSRDPVIAGATLGAVCFTFVNGYLHTALLTDGVIFSILLIWIMPSGKPRADPGDLDSSAPESEPIQAVASNQSAAQLQTDLSSLPFRRPRNVLPAEGSCEHD